MRQLIIPLLVLSLAALSEQSVAEPHSDTFATDLRAATGVEFNFSSSLSREAAKQAFDNMYSIRDKIAAAKAALQLVIVLGPEQIGNSDLYRLRLQHGIGNDLAVPFDLKPGDLARIINEQAIPTEVAKQEIIRTLPSDGQFGPLRFGSPTTIAELKAWAEADILRGLFLPGIKNVEIVENDDLGYYEDGELNRDVASVVISKRLLESEARRRDHITRYQYLTDLEARLSKASGLYVQLSGEMFSSSFEADLSAQFADNLEHVFAGLKGKVHAVRTLTFGEISSGGYIIDDFGLKVSAWSLKDVGAFKNIIATIGDQGDKMVIFHRQLVHLTNTSHIAFKAPENEKNFYAGGRPEDVLGLLRANLALFSGMTEVRLESCEVPEPIKVYTERNDHRVYMCDNVTAAMLQDKLGDGGSVTGSVKLENLPEAPPADWQEANHEFLLPLGYVLTHHIDPGLANTAATAPASDTVAKSDDGTATSAAGDQRVRREKPKSCGVASRGEDESSSSALLLLAPLLIAVFSKKGGRCQIWCGYHP